VARKKERKIDGSYVIDIYIDTPDGKRKRVQKQGFKTVKERDAEIARLRGDEVVGIDPSGGGLTVASLGEMMIAEKRATLRAAHTVSNYDQAFRLYINPVIGRIKLADLRTSLPVDRLRDSMLASGLSASTVALYMQMLRYALNWAVKKRLVVRNVALESSLPKAAKTRFELPTVEQMAAALRLINETPVFQPEAVADRTHWRVLFLLLQGTGMRINEALSLRWEDIDLDELTVKIRVSKTLKGQRTITITREEAADLAELMPRRFVGGGYVFVRLDGVRLQALSAWELFKSVGERAGFRLYPHLLRHYHASTCIQVGMTDKQIQERLGHESVVTTMNTYGHLRPNFDRDTAGQASALLRAAMAR
jgi:integrase